jgi:hypothetical protein
MSASMRFTCESGSNEIAESDSQLAKHRNPKISIIRGISIDQVITIQIEMIECESIVNLIQMK